MRKRPRTRPETSAPKKRTSKPLPPPTPSEAAFERALADLIAGNQGKDRRDLTPLVSATPRVEAKNGESAAAFVERAFSNRQQYLSREPYAGIGDAESFHTKVMGVSFEGRQDVVGGLREDYELDLIREPQNPHDANAIAVRYGSMHLGYLRKEIAKHVAPHVDAGAIYRARVASLTGGPSRTAADRNRGVNIFVWRSQANAPTASGSAAQRAEALAADASSLRRALIGEHEPHMAQREVLARIDGGKNVLALFGTGRGKSFCFQYAAARRALREQAKTLIVYPLRALANDQHEALARKLEPFGLRVLRANGAITPEQREDLFAALRDGAWDIILATPEFLEFHHAAFTAASFPSMVVVDEAHHVLESRHRAAYAQLGRTIAGLGSPQVIACTATAASDAFTEIQRQLGINAWVIDPTVRDNLELVEARETENKIEYLANLFSSEPTSKGIVYCMSRSEAVKVAVELRSRVGNEVMYYHALVPTADRLAAEQFFREGAIRIVVATSAFGEGIDLPNVRHVVLYHLNFNFTEFNQQAGRAGRDGEDAQIHLLFGKEDQRINDYIIDRATPTLPTLRQLYRGMRALTSNGMLRMPYGEIARTLDLDKVHEDTVGAALRIFDDARLTESGFDEDGRFVRFLPVGEKIDLTQNERFAEGEAERDSFRRFADFALTASIDTLERIVNRPIYPDRVPLMR